MKVIQINTSIAYGSTGSIAEDLGRICLNKGYDCIAVYGRVKNKSALHLIRTSNRIDLAIHLLLSRIFDKHGFGSILSTKKLLRKIKKINPDIIHLHNIHGYYLNVRVLFNYLKQSNTPVIWTLHDCWSFTGHCSHFMYVNCNKWEKACFKCPNKNGYPKSIFLDSSKSNYRIKKKLFTGLEKLTIVTPSLWLFEVVGKSFLKAYPRNIIINGINLDVFNLESTFDAKKRFEIPGKFILGVANVWTLQKGYNDFLKLRGKLSKEITIVLVGVSQKQKESLPNGIIGILRTKNQNELAELYRESNVYVNPTYSDNFPTTNLEALACGTPVITYNTGGSPEAIDNNTGFVVEKGNIQGICNAIQVIRSNGKNSYINKCRARAEKLYNKTHRYNEYLSLYSEILGK